MSAKCLHCLWPSLQVKHENLCTIQSFKSCCSVNVLVKAHSSDSHCVFTVNPSLQSSLSQQMFVEHPVSFSTANYNLDN